MIAHLSHRTRLLLLAAVVLVTLLIATSLAAQESWLPILRLQLQQSHQCTLKDVVSVREVPVGNDVGLEGRVRCLDMREYDFTRQRPHQKFDIRLCQPTVC